MPEVCAKTNSGLPERRASSVPCGEPGGPARKLPASERNIRLTLAFDGSPYHGWQMQEQLPTVQGVLTQAIRTITGESVQLTGSGRTDAGTHARAFVANFRTAAAIPAAGIVRALNSLLPADIRILSARRAPRDFDARRSARSKVYQYQICRSPVLPPHLAREHFHYPWPLDVALMKKAAALFEGTHDFASFAATARRARAPGDREPRTTTRTIYRCLLQERSRRLTLTVEGSGFLHHMIRNMVGTLLEVGRRRMGLGEFRGLFSRRDRRLAGFTAPAHGLILVRVRY